MKWTVLIISIMMLLCIAASGQPNSYSNTAPGSAPTPIPPSSAASLGLQAPTDITATQQTPTAQERTQTLMSASQDAAYAFAPGGTRATATSPVYNKMIVPTGSYAPNSLYISYAPRTVASCNLYGNLPLWMKTSTRGYIWFYEWYPSGMLDTQYAGYVYYPGWHILQYYCGGWSNYAYIYVSGPGSYWVNPNPSPSPVPYPYPNWDSQITYTYPPTGHTYYSYKTTTSYGN
jgi:hypothetical protein